MSATSRCYYGAVRHNRVQPMRRCAYAGGERVHKVDWCQARPSPREILVHMVLQGEYGLKRLVRLPGPGDIREASMFSMASGHTSPFRQSSDGGLVQALAGSARVTHCSLLVDATDGGLHAPSLRSACTHSQPQQPNVSRRDKMGSIGSKQAEIARNGRRSCE